MQARQNLRLIRYTYNNSYYLHRLIYIPDSQFQNSKEEFEVAWDTGLVGVHLAIAGYPNSPLRVLAGPGTGKTFAMMRRVARLLEAGVPPHEILAVTFTRTAAHDLVGKLTTLGVPGANQVAAKTLHSLSFSVLGRAAVFQATQRTPRPLLDCELEMMVNDLKEQFGGKREVRRLIKAFEGILGNSPTSHSGLAHGPYRTTISQCFDELASLPQSHAGR